MTLENKAQNKLELVKSFYQTADTNKQNIVGLKKAVQSRTVELKRSIIPFKFAVSSCFEIFKSCFKNETTPKHINKFTRNLIFEKRATPHRKLFEFFDEIQSTNFLNFEFNSFENVIQKMSEYLSFYNNTFYTFNDDSIDLLQKPSYRNFCQLRLELTTDAINV